MAALLPLYPELPSSPLEREAGLEVDHGCTLCGLSEAKPKTVCISAEGEPGGVLIVGGASGRAEDAVGRPFVGEAGRYLRAAVARHWSGPVAYDLAVRCPPGREGATRKQIRTCGAYLAHTLREVRPTRVLALGEVAAESVLGRRVNPLSERRAYGWIVDAHAAGPSPVFVLSDPARVMSNRFLRGWFDEDLEWALTAEPPAAPPWTGAATRVVETAADAEEAAAELRAAPWFAFDTETCGAMFHDDFEVIDLAAVAAGSGAAWSWDRAALDDPARAGPLRDLMSDQRAKKVGSNTKYDQLAVRLGLGVAARGVIGDVRLWRRLLDPDASGALDNMSELVGFGGHKEEMEVALRRAILAIRKGEVAPGADEHVEAIVRLGGAAKNPRQYAFGLVDHGLRVRYCARDALATARLAEHLRPRIEADPGLSLAWREIVGPAARALEHVERWGVCVDTGALRAFSAYLDGKLHDIKLRLDAAGGPDFDPKKVAQVGELLFARLGLQPQKFTEKRGAPSTDAEALEGLRGAHPVVADILDWRHYDKLKGTYADGMLQHVRPDGRIHPSILLDGARSGRTSCKDPNLQNIPRAETPDGKMARDVFAAPPGWKVLSADYAQLEYRVAAMLSGDPEMRRALASGEDFHLATAKMISQIAWGIPPEEVGKQHRTAAKAVNFGSMYGLSARELAARLGIAIEAAERIQAAILGRYSRYAAWSKAQVRKVGLTGHVRTWWGGADARLRWLWRIADPDRGFSDGVSKARNGSFNSPIQGTASDFCLRSLTSVVDWIMGDGVPAMLMLPVHDALLIQVRDDAVEEVCREVRAIMISHETDGVPLEVDVEVGPSWGSLTKVGAAG